MDVETRFWKRCSSCKKEIGYSTTYQVCNVSTCNRKRTGLVFCSVACWEMHLPLMRHREAYAVEKRSPSLEKWRLENEVMAAKGSGRGASKGRASGAGRSSSSGPTVRKRASAAPSADGELPRDILIVVTKAKNYIRARSGMNTSDGVMPVLSEHVRMLCNVLINNARQDGRKTIMDRDMPAPMSMLRAGDDESPGDDLPRDILIVASKLKKYVRAKSGMNTSDSVMSGLSDHVRSWCNLAIRNAGKDGRRTVLDRDVPGPSDGPVVRARPPASD
ncbi:MAG: hypothetical protein AAGC55_11980 [Myxococcota bacterium]